MANKHPHSLRNGIIATVVGGLILSAIPQLRSLLVEAILWVWEGVIWVWAALISGYSLPGWVLLIVGFFALVGLVSLYAVLGPQNEPKFRKYTEDTLYGAKWRWDWTGNKISGLWCFCPSCDAQLVYSESFAKTDFICERCPSVGEDCHYRSQGRVVSTVEGGNRHYAVSAAEREILRRIRTSARVPSNS